MVRITSEDLKRHIRYIESHTKYKISEGNTYYIGNKECYTVSLDGEDKAVIVSNVKNDIWDMLNPFWWEAFHNDK